MRQSGRRGLTAVAAVVVVATAAASEPSERVAAHGQAEPRYRERISVTLDQRVVRVVDRRGRPVLGLGVDDFEVRAGGQPVTVAAVDWVSAAGGAAAGSGAPGGGAARRLVLWIQADLNAVRIKGHLRMLPVIRELLEELPPAVEAAVLSFDSRLKLWSGFTSDHRSLAGLIESAVRFGSQPPAGAGGGPLAARLAALDASQQFNAEDAMLATARALGGFDGEKELVVLGWGIGRTGPGSPGAGPAYRRAERALLAASVSVFVLDVTDAGAHSLEAGLRRLADRTGGTYDKTHSYARQATRRLLRTLEGHYLLSLDRGDREPPAGGYRIQLRDGVAGRLLADAG